MKKYPNERGNRIQFDFRAFILAENWHLHWGSPFVRRDGRGSSAA